MSASRIDSAGKVTRLDGKADPEEVVTEADVKDPAKLAKMLARVLATVAGLRRSFVAKRVDFEELTVLSAGNTVSVQHNFNGNVRWWVIDGTTFVFAKRNTTLTTATTLALDVSGSVNGTFSLRVEHVG